MRSGDISNELAPGVGIRFERVIKTEEGKLNRSAKAYIQSIMRIDCNVNIITTGDARRVMAFAYKWGVPYSKVIEASPLEIPDICRENDLLTYYDVDQNILQNINSRGKGLVDAKLWTSFEVA